MGVVLSMGVVLGVVQGVVNDVWLAIWASDLEAKKRLALRLFGT